MQNTAQILPDVSSPVLSRQFTEDELIAIVREYSGQIATLKTRKTLKLKKSAPAGLMIEKESIFQVRIGVAYENKAAVKEIREAGKEAIPLSAKGWEVVEFPFLVRSIKSGKLALACSSVLNGNHKRSFFMNGREVAGEMLNEFCYASDLTSGEPPLWFTVYLENIISVC